MRKRSVFSGRGADMSLTQKLGALNWFVVLLIVAIATIGLVTLYSVAGGSMEPWAGKQAIRFALFLPFMIAIALVPVRFWMTVAYPALGASMLLLIAVELIGAIGMGGQRWLDLGPVRLQPSEFCKVSLVMSLARYYHSLSLGQTQRLSATLVPLAMIAVPALLVIIQPDLGTGIMMTAGGLSVMFLAGARMWLFVGGASAVGAALPVVWSMLHQYQRDRVLIFLDPELDPRGAGYQILQSKIAIGSAGLSGKGYLHGTQSHLNFLPETKTDFIFTAFAEEWGLIGGLILIGLFLALIGYGFWVATSCRHQFGRLLAGGLSMTLFFYLIINVGMVMGLLPVVGVPLPLVSYGGSVALTFAIAYGLIFSVAIHRDANIARRNPFG